MYLPSRIRGSSSSWWRSKPAIDLPVAATNAARRNSISIVVMREVDKVNQERCLFGDAWLPILRRTRGACHAELGEALSNGG